MPDDMKKTIIEAIKELFRVVLLAAIPVAVSSLENDGVIDVKAILLVIAVAVLRAVDKGLHEWGKVIESEALKKGITQF